MILDGKRSYSLRRWNEQSSRHQAICFTTLGFLWALVAMTYLLRGVRLPPDDSTVADEGTHFITDSSSNFGSSRGWDSISPEVQEEIKWMRTKSSEEDNLSGQIEAHRVAQERNLQKANSHVSSSLGIASKKTEKWSSGEAKDVLKAKAIEEEDFNDILIFGPDTSRIKEDQDTDELGVVVEEDSNGEENLQPPNETLKGLQAARELIPKGHLNCATVEEMGSAAVGDTDRASLRLRRMIRLYFAEHGATRVRQLPSNLFCERSFVLGKALEDGFGNNMYKLLTAAGLGMILNRSLIVAEAGATNPLYLGKNNSPPRFPFGDYLSYSDEAFSMREVKRLWVHHNCSGQYNRPLVLKKDDFDIPKQSTVLCEDWTTWTYPILWFVAQDTVALQFLLKNQHFSLRSAATVVLGDPFQPDSRPNTFGELMMAVVKPKSHVKEAVEWALRRGWDPNKGSEPESPDVALHLRMRRSASKAGPQAATSCIMRILNNMSIINHRKPRIVVVSDTPSVLAFVKKSSLALSADIISFDYKAFLSSYSRSSDFSLRADNFLPPSKRRRDWGPLPRWVAVVDFYLAASARHAVVTGADHRVGTTYAQLVGSLAAAYTLEEKDGGEQLQQPARFYSSFQKSLLVPGLKSQGGWGHSWHPFGGKLSCPNQPPQCAFTPLLPYAWWDAPLQSPTHRDQVKMRQWGLVVESNGAVVNNTLQDFCLDRKHSTSEAILLALPESIS